MLSPDGLRLAFSRNSGDYNLFVTTRASRSAAFATPVRLTELEIPGEDETDPWLSADGHTLVFTRGSTTDRDLYITTR